MLPDIDTLKYFYAKYSEKIYPFWDNAYDRDRAEKNAEELFTHLMKEKLYYKFLCNCLFDISNSMEINTILKIYDYKYNPQSNERVRETMWEAGLCTIPCFH